MGLWFASRWVTPVTGKTRIELLAPGAPVSIGGVSVSEGDLVVGDETGIVVVPRARLDEVLAEAERILEIDFEGEQGIKQGRSFAEAAAAANYIPDRK